MPTALPRAHRAPTSAPVLWGIAPIGWRNDDLPELGADATLRQLLSEVALAGFDGTEVGGFFPQDPHELATEARLRGLRIAAQWFSSYILRDGLEAAVEAFRAHCAYLRAVGAPIAVVSEQSHSIQNVDDASVFSGKPVLSETDLATLARGLETLGAVAHEYDVALAYHPHMGTVVQTAAETAALMAQTDPSVVGLLYDTGHAFVADGDPLTVLRPHLDRVRHVHFKDVRASALERNRARSASFRASFLDGMFTVPGDGAIDFRVPFDLLLEASYRGWIVVEAEQDPAKANPLQYALMARRYVDEVLLGDR